MYIHQNPKGNMITHLMYNYSVTIIHKTLKLFTSNNYKGIIKYPNKSLYIVPNNSAAHSAVFLLPLSATAKKAIAEYKNTQWCTIKCKIRNVKHLLTIYNFFSQISPLIIIQF